MEEEKTTQPVDAAVTPSAQPTPEQAKAQDAWDEAAIAELLRNTPAVDDRDQLPPMSVLVLWAFGLLIGGGSLVWFVASAVSVCSPNDSMCSINTLTNMMFSSMGLLLGAVVFVSGLFSLRRLRRRK
jgi:hypothetical protein